MLAKKIITMKKFIKLNLFLVDFNFYYINSNTNPYSFFNLYIYLRKKNKYAIES